MLLLLSLWGCDDTGHVSPVESPVTQKSEIEKGDLSLDADVFTVDTLSNIGIEAYPVSSYEDMVQLYTDPQLNYPPHWRDPEPDPGGPAPPDEELVYIGDVDIDHFPHDPTPTYIIEFETASWIEDNDGNIVEETIDMISASAIVYNDVHNANNLLTEVSIINYDHYFAGIIGNTDWIERPFDFGGGGGVGHINHIYGEHEFDDNEYGEYTIDTFDSDIVAPIPAP